MAYINTEHQRTPETPDDCRVPPRVFRIGVVGAGAWSHNQLEAWSRVREARVVALCDRDAARRIAAVERFEVPLAFQDAAAMLDEAELDALDICARPSSHAELVRLAAERGLPVLCQKPFCTSLEEAEAVVEHCREAGVRLMINENYRWQPWYRKAKEVLASGIIGEPFFALLQERSRLSLPKFDHPQRYLAEMPRLIVYEVGVHYLDVMRFLFGEPETIYARLQRVSPHVQGEDVEAIVLGYPRLTAAITSSFASVPVPFGGAEVADPLQPPRFEIDGELGTLAVRGESLDVYSDAGRWSYEIADGWSESFAGPLRHFVECLRTGEGFETSGVDTLKTLGLVYAAYQSAEAGQVVQRR